jgi:hypothetical protein
LKGEKNKVLPADYKEFVSEQPLIANKQFYTMTKLTQKQVLSDDFDKARFGSFQSTQTAQ